MRAQPSSGSQHCWSHRLTSMFQVVEESAVGGYRSYDAHDGKYVSCSHLPPCLSCSLPCYSALPWAHRNKNSQSWTENADWEPIYTFKCFLLGTICKSAGSNN